MTQDSPSTKLLFAKDLPRYRKQVAQFYADVQQMSPLSDADMMNYTTNLAMVGQSEFLVTF